MNNSVKNVIIFLSGAAAGSVITWRVLKKRYEQIAQEEIDSVKEVFSKRQTKDAEPEIKNEERTVVDEAREKPDIAEYTSKLKEFGYIHSEEGEEKDMEKPYVIEPEEFGTFEDYDTVSLTYYADGILADDLDELVDDIEGIIGEDSLGHFGEYEDDAVHVRNDRLKVDYEILRDLRTYEEVVGHNVYGSEVEEQ